MEEKKILTPVIVSCNFQVSVLFVVVLICCCVLVGEGRIGKDVEEEESQEREVDEGGSGMRKRQWAPGGLCG